jgi:NitT/TauT family transport system permease protein
MVLTDDSVHVESSSGLASTVLLPLASLAAAIGAWWAIVTVFSIPRYIIPSPAAVFTRMAESRATLLSNAVASGEIAALALLISLVVGVLIGTVVARWALAKRFLMPPVVAVQSLPKVALAPLFIAWLGFGALPKVFITLLITFFPIMVATTVGMESVSRDTVYMARSMGCRSRKLLTFILLPAAAPYIGAAFRTSATLAIVGVLVSEFVGSANGLGNLLLLASGNRDTTLAFAAIVVVSLLGVLFYAVAAVLTRVATARLGSHYARSVT